MRTKTRRNGQSTLELCIMLGVVVIAFVALQRYVKYAYAGRLKSSADSISQTLFNPHDSITKIDVDRKTTDTVHFDAGTLPGEMKSITETNTDDGGKAWDKTTRTDIVHDP